MNTPEKPTGRPRKEAAERRGKPIAFRVSEDERAAIEAAAVRAGMTVSEYARTMTLTGRLVVQQRTGLADIDRADLGRIGNNLNQIARHLNAGRLVPAGAVQAALADWQRLVNQFTEPGA